MVLLGLCNGLCNGIAGFMEWYCWVYVMALLGLCNGRAVSSSFWFMGINPFPIFSPPSPLPPLLCDYSGLVVKVSTSRVERPRFESQAIYTSDCILLG